MSQSTQNPENKPCSSPFEFEETFEFGGVEVPFDSSECETAKRFEDGIERMREEQKLIPKDGSLSDAIGAFCRVYEHLIDGMFGDGTYMKMCGGKYSMHVTNQLYNKLISAINCQRIANESIKAGAAMKYLPNRSARRAAAQK
ncbi:MAG: DUF6673 family protein [Clostridia bacterium]